MSETTTRLLQAAADAVGGKGALARRLGIAETLLSSFMTGSRELPDALLLRAVDILLAEREARRPEASRAS